MAATLRAVAGEAAATAAPTLSPSVPPRSAPPVTTDQGLGVTIGSSSVWAGPAGPVIFSLSAAGTRIDDPDLVPRVQLETRDGAPIGPELSAVAVRPPGETRVLYVASPAIPGPGWWRIAVSADRAGITL